MREPVAELARALDPGWIQADLTGADRAAAALAAYFEDELRRRAAHPPDDLLGRMLGVQFAEPLAHPTEDLVANAVLMLLAGFETTIGLLGNGLAVLLERPDLVWRMRERPEDSGRFVAEVLRFDPPVQLTGRRASRGTTVGDVAVEEGDSVVLALGAANRDPRRFRLPDEFVLDRPPSQPISFGFGRHHCIGARLARLEGELAFRALAAREPQLRAVGIPTRLDRLNLRVFSRFPVALAASSGSGQAAGSGAASQESIRSPQLDHR
jgi:cytochrome P450